VVDTQCPTPIGTVSVAPALREMPCPVLTARCPENPPPRGKQTDQAAVGSTLTRTAATSDFPLARARRV
jgi:hypothetical protein